MSSCSLWLARRALLHTRGPVPRARTASETILPGCGLSIGLRGVRCACQRPRAMAGLVGPGGQLSRAMALGRPELSPAVKGGTCNHMRNIQPCRPFHEMHRPRPRMRARPVEASVFGPLAGLRHRHSSSMPTLRSCDYTLLADSAAANVATAWIAAGVEGPPGYLGGDRPRSLRLLARV